jgi:hypothetical protein
MVPDTHCLYKWRWANKVEAISVDSLTVLYGDAYLLELTSKLASVREKELRIIMYLTSKFYSTLISLAE